MICFPVYWVFILSPFNISMNFIVSEVKLNIMSTQLLAYWYLIIFQVTRYTEAHPSSTD